MPETDSPHFSETDIRVTGPWLSSDVKCKYVDDSNVSLPGSVYVDRIWASYKTRYPFAHDGPMLGLVEVLAGTWTGLHLSVRPTSYSQYVATRDPSFATTHPSVSRANPIGTTIIILTADDMVVVTRRSLDADQNAGLAYFVGGYAEPPASVDIEDIVGTTMIREVNEELGITCSNVIVTGVANDPVFCHPEIFAVSRVSIQAKEISKMWQIARDRSESSELLLVSLEELLSTPPGRVFTGQTTWSLASATFLLRSSWKDVVRLLGS